MLPPTHSPRQKDGRIEHSTSNGASLSPKSLTSLTSSFTITRLTKQRGSLRRRRSPKCGRTCLSSTGQIGSTGTSALIALVEHRAEHGTQAAFSLSKESPPTTIPWIWRCQIIFRPDRRPKTNRRRQHSYGLILSVPLLCRKSPFAFLTHTQGYFGLLRPFRQRNAKIHMTIPTSECFLVCNSERIDWLYLDRSCELPI